MKTISFQQLLNWISGATLRSAAHLDLARTCSGVSTDTRTLRPNDAYIALRGQQYDGHRFIDHAYRAQASLAVVAFDSELAGLAQAAALPLLVVPHTGKALMDLAKGYRAQFDLSLAVVVGSNGKTTAKEMVFSILKAHAMSLGLEQAVHSTVGNFNNEIGVPLTLLRLSESHRYSVVELGMNHPGETMGLAQMAVPCVALINNAQREHQEFMQTVEAVALEHADVIDALASAGIAVIPAQDAYAAIWRSRAQILHKQVIEFALHNEEDQTPAQVYGYRNEQGLMQQLQMSVDGEVAIVQLKALGEHNARNALAAAATAHAMGIPLASIVAGLEAFNPVKGRMQHHQRTCDGGVYTLIDDTYNANPDSVAAAIKVLDALPGHTTLVLGDMGEVGDQGESFHREVGVMAARSRIGQLFTLGTLCAHTHAAFAAESEGKVCLHFESMGELASVLIPRLQAGQTVLIKGSRFMRMETLFDLLTKQMIHEPQPLKTVGLATELKVSA